jgi:PIN domain nuclease of toxin-antitoxin system
MVRIPEIAVTDTHGLIWWITDQRRLLGRKAARFFKRVDEGAAVVCIPSLVLVELDEAVVYGDVVLDEPFPDFVERLVLTPSRYQVVDLTPEVVVRAHELFAIPERGDRLIAATAAVLGYPLITRDPEIVAAISGHHLWA